jgi:hypothetical protein
MNTPVAARGTWDKVEYFTSYFLMVVLASVIATRLAFASIWALPELDLVLSVVALALVMASFWIARTRRSWRFWIIGYASATQLLPMVIRHPGILLPLIGALIPVLIAIWALIALSRKDTHGRPRSS